MLNLDWPQIRLVVFDVDGTLYDQSCLRRKMIRQLSLHCLRHPGDIGVLRVISTYRRCREQLADEESDRIGDLQYERPAARLGIDAEEVRRTVQDWMLERPLGHLRSCRYANVADWVTALRAQGKTVAVFSDYPATEKLRALDLGIDLVVSAVDPEVDCLKPRPQGLQRLLELTGVAPHQAVLIGDRDDRDGECARRAGVSYLIKSREPAVDGHQFQDYGHLVRSLHSDRAENAALQ